MFMDKLKAILAIPHRIAALENKISELEVALAKSKITNSLSLMSPDGSRKIELMCQNNSAGIWISSETGSPMVAIYNDKHQGAVVGIWGQADADGYRRGGLDVALSHTKTKGGIIQMMSPDNKIYDITTDSPIVGKGSSLGPNRSKF